MTTHEARPAMWSVLSSDDSDSIVVPQGTEVADAVVVLLSERYGGRFSPGNPAIVAACEGVKVEVWRSCSRALMEAEGVGDGESDWWAPFGDGKRSIHVVDIGQSAYSLGEAAAEYEPEPE